MKEIITTTYQSEDGNVYETAWECKEADIKWREMEGKKDYQVAKHYESLIVKDNLCFPMMDADYDDILITWVRIKNRDDYETIFDYFARGIFTGRVTDNWYENYRDEDDWDDDDVAGDWYLYIHCENERIEFYRKEEVDAELKAIYETIFDDKGE